MKYLSLCSGIEAATVAWHPLGWEAVAYSEIERFPSEVLAHHYPSTPNLGDMTKFKEWSIESNVDLLVGGTPCQSFSVAGLRKGLDDPRGNLMLTYLAIAKQHRPNWLVWENVPGVLSSNGGRDFGSFLGGLAECGYGFAYRVLDAQYFGVAQRRRRVFVVGYLGDWRAAAAVLFERHSLSGHPAPSREKREVTPTLTKEGTRVSRTGHNEDGWYLTAPKPSRMVAFGEYSDDGTEPMLDIAPCLTKADQHGVAQPIAYAFDSLASNSMKSANPISGCNEVDVSKALDTSRGLDPSCNQGGIGVAQPIPFGVSEKPDVGHCLRSGASRADKHESTTYVAQPTIVHGTQDPCVSDIAFAQGRNNGGENVLMQAIGWSEELNALEGVQPTIQRGGQGGRHEGVMTQSMAVRRLTPKECERLQGFPDNYTDIKSKNKPTPDGPRYKALGNSMAVPVMAWIGQRIQEVEAICKQNK